MEKKKKMYATKFFVNFLTRRKIDYAIDLNLDQGHKNIANMVSFPLVFSRHSNFIHFSFHSQLSSKKKNVQTTASQKKDRASWCRMIYRWEKVCWSNFSRFMWSMVNIIGFYANNFHDDASNRKWMRSKHTKRINFRKIDVHRKS